MLARWIPTETGALLPGQICYESLQKRDSGQVQDDPGLGCSSCRLKYYPCASRDENAQAEQGHRVTGGWTEIMNVHIRMYSPLGSNSPRLLQFETRLGWPNSKIIEARE